MLEMSFGAQRRIRAQLKGGILKMRILFLTLCLTFITPSLFAVRQIDLNAWRSKAEVKLDGTQVPMVYCACYQNGSWFLSLFVEDALTGNRIGDRYLASFLQSLDECRNKGQSNPRCQ